MPFISLVRIGDVSPEVCARVAEGISRRLGLACLVSGDVVELDFAYDERRGQHCSTRLLERLRERAEGVRVLGVADVDLFMPVLTFVFGEAILGGRAAVVSLHRLRQTVYGLPDEPGLTLLRAEREAVHELGHTFGLVHCPDYTCIMHATRSVEEIDLASGGLCRACGARISEAIRGMSGNGRLRQTSLETFPDSPPPRRRRSILSALFPFLKGQPQRVAPPQNPG
jgi:archaemetzincin